VARKLKSVKGECAICNCVNCLCPECGGAIELHSNQFRYPGALWKTVASYFGKAQSATPRKQGQPIITVAFAEVEGECWQDE